MMPLKRLLVVENEPRDLKLAADTARTAGIEEVDGRMTLISARTYLEKGLSGEGPLPDGVLLDLDLGYDSGYELLRFLRSSPRLSEIPIVIWSIMGEEQRNMCKLYKVTSFVGKWEGGRALQEALDQMSQGWFILKSNS